MVELKTLKELILPYTEDDGSMGWISPVDLKQEAIKWIKAIDVKPDKRDIKIETFEDVANNAIRAVLTEETDIVVRWIKHFFNITDEELNEVE